ncbi:hypothetical protein AV530_009929 [Patagioenas fasciata monilis]|uniref:Uncharacterized protein n=1 Tax=Patagioenas fasciata monilis TaxID=372326 RepID=A0A1V4KAS5_PATFA|nr:hypothetical protein AV530_009929 [Patagioenas fasciata monilis]
MWTIVEAWVHPCQILLAVSLFIRVFMESRAQRGCKSKPCETSKAAALGALLATGEEPRHLQYSVDQSSWPCMSCNCWRAEERGSSGN